MEKEQSPKITKPITEGVASKEENKFTDVFLTEKDENGRRYIATWVYSVLLIVTLFISLLAIPALSNGSKEQEKTISLQLEGTSTVHVSVNEQGISAIEVSQPKANSQTQLTQLTQAPILPSYSSAPQQSSGNKLLGAGKQGGENLQNKSINNATPTTDSNTSSPQGNEADEADEEGGQPEVGAKPTKEELLRSAPLQIRQY
jgi:hypothetical protein